jgi:hypothetical protein
MRTPRQSNGDVAVDIVRRHCNCSSCGQKRWKLVGREQHGVDLQCTACGRLAESKGIFCGERIRFLPRPVIPGGSFAVRERQRQQHHRVDLYVTLWDRHLNFVVRAIPAERQPPGLVTARRIQTGTRAGYQISEIHLGALPKADFPVIAEHVVRGAAAPGKSAGPDRGNAATPGG